jgi:hypothetical protein
MARRPLRLSEMCPELQAAVADPMVGLFYYQRYRYYGLPDLWPGKTPRSQGHWGERGRNRPYFYNIYYCPFSGILLPGDVADIFDRVVRRELGFTSQDLFDERSYRRLPKEFKYSEAWWVKRHIGLTQFPRTVRAAFADAENRGWFKDGEYVWESFEDCPDWPASLTRSRERPPHYCAKTAYAMYKSRSTYWYIPRTREYGLRIVDPFIRIENQPIRILPVRYCPWCGEKLPTSLKAEWLSRIGALGLSEDSPDIPAPLANDAWWKAEEL